MFMRKLEELFINTKQEPVKIFIKENNNIISKILENTDYEIHTIENINQSELDKEGADLLIIQIENNTNILKKIQHTPYIVICDKQDAVSIIEAFNIGAYTCITNPIDSAELQNIIKNCLEFNKSNNDNTLAPIVTKSAAIQKTIKKIKPLKNAHTIVLSGERGCGKKFLAKYFAKQWNKNSYIIDFENINVLKTFNQLKSLLDLNTNKLIILNHPEQLTANLQMQLTSIIHQTIGTNKTQWISIINSQDEKNLIPRLYDRIGIFDIKLPNMLEREEDLIDIIKIMQKQIAKQLNKKVKKIDIKTIRNKEWPYNFKELYKYIEQMFYISNEIEETENLNILLDDVFMSLDLKDATKLFEKTYLMKQLIAEKGSIKEAAEKAKINRTTLYRKLK